MSKPSLAVLFLGLGFALAATPLLGIAAVWCADRLADWDGRRSHHQEPEVREPPAIVTQEWRDRISRIRAVELHEGFELPDFGYVGEDT